MTKSWMKWGVGVAMAAAIVGCSGGDKASEATTGGTSGATSGLSGKVTVDGSSTVFPIASIWVEDFKGENAGVEITANKSGTGSGFKKFATGEIDIATASRPIEAKEIEALTAAKIDFVELPIAYDGLTVVVNPQNAWATDLTIAQLKQAWNEGSTVKKWSDLNPAYPQDPITFYGPTDNHGTYDYFTEAVNGKKNVIRKDYQPNQEFNAIVQAVSGDKNAIAFMGVNYYEENKDKVKAVKVNGVEPTPETIADGTYTPLSRPLFIYVNAKSLDRPEVKAFVEYALGKGLDAVTEAKYVKLSDGLYAKILARATAKTTGSAFTNAAPGSKLDDLLK